MVSVRRSVCFVLKGRMVREKTTNDFNQSHGSPNKNLEFANRRANDSISYRHFKCKFPVSCPSSVGWSVNTDWTYRLCLWLLNNRIPVIFMTNLSISAQGLTASRKSNIPRAEA